MYRIILLVSLFIGNSACANASFNPWSATSVDAPLMNQENREQTLIKLDNDLLIRKLRPGAGAAKNTYIDDEMDFPLPEGGFVTLRLTPSNMAFHSDKGNLLFFELLDAETGDSRGVMSITPLGFHGMLMIPHRSTILIDPVQSEKGDAYHVYAYSGRKFAANHSMNFRTLQPSGTTNRIKQANRSLARKTDNGIRVYRLAVAATGEYTSYFGSVENAQAAIATTISRVNAIYKRDLGIQLKLIDDTNIIFSRPGEEFNEFTDILTLVHETPDILNQHIGFLNYDIGHVFSTAGKFGGIAMVGSLCNTDPDYKALGASASPTPDTGIFDIDFVAHEIGHQLGATHTFNSSRAGICDNRERDQDTAFEPGSGASIMSYAGMCDDNNVRESALAQFHIGSIEQIRMNLEDLASTAPTCGLVETAEVNQPPVIVETTPELTVGIGESFTLTGQAYDPDGDSLIYSWDQHDAGHACDLDADMQDNALYPPTELSNSPESVFPGLATMERDIDFKFVVRDGKGGVTSQLVTVKVRNQKQGVKSIEQTDTAANTGAGMISFLVYPSGLLIFLLSRTMSRKNREAC